MSDRTLGRARGLNTIADPAQFKGTRGRPGGREGPPEIEPTDPVVDHPPAVTPETPAPEPRSAATETPAPHRAVVPGVQRKRRELSVPIPVAEAVEATGINAADLVMRAYRNHGDAVFAGAGGRMVSRGRQRLRLSISDAEFDRLTRLGANRGWNRSETVAVLLTLELLGEAANEQPA